MHPITVHFRAIFREQAGLDITLIPPVAGGQGS